MRDGVTLKKVVVVFKSHFDLGFTDTAKHVFRQMENMFRKAAEVCEQTAHWPEGKRYVWTVPSWPLWHCLNDASVSRELKNRLEELVRQGRIVYHALPGTLSSELCGGGPLPGPFHCP